MTGEKRGEDDKDSAHVWRTLGPCRKSISEKNGQKGEMKKRKKTEPKP